MDVKEYCIANLGKEVRFKDYFNEEGLQLVEGMIVGYSTLGSDGLLVSFFNNLGWEATEEEIKEKDHCILLLHSPLNQTYWHIGISEIIK